MIFGIVNSVCLNVKLNKEILQKEIMEIIHFFPKFII